MKPTKYVTEAGAVTYKLNYVIHRVNGPAIEYSDGTKAWFVNGKRHRLDGPAIVYADGDNYWFVDDIEYNTEVEYWVAVQQYVDTHQPTKYVDVDGSVTYELDGRLHRTDGPARERINGNKEWWVNNKLHRTDGPAVEVSNGTKVWYVNGDRHRLDGPAVEWYNGNKEWWVNDIKYYTEFEYWIAVQQYVDTHQLA